MTSIVETKGSKICSGHLCNSSVYILDIMSLANLTQLSSRSRMSFISFSILVGNFTIYKIYQMADFSLTYLAQNRNDLCVKEIPLIRLAVFLIVEEIRCQFVKLPMYSLVNCIIYSGLRSITIEHN